MAARPFRAPIAIGGDAKRTAGSQQKPREDYAFGRGCRLGEVARESNANATQTDARGAKLQRRASCSGHFRPVRMHAGTVDEELAVAALELGVAGCWLALRVEPGDFKFFWPELPDINRRARAEAEHEERVRLLAARSRTSLGTSASRSASYRGQASTLWCASS